MRVRSTAVLVGFVACVLGARAREAAAHEDDMRAFEEAWEEAIAPRGLLAPFEPMGGDRSLAVSLDVGLGRRSTRAGPQMVTFVGIVVAIPLDRLFGAGRPPAVRLVDDGFPRGLSARPEETMRNSRRWGAALALPSALALVPVARGGSSAVRTAAGSSSGASSLASSLRLAPSIAAAIRASASAPSASSNAASNASADASPNVVLDEVAAPSSPLPAGAVRALVRAAWHEAKLDDDDRLDELAGRARAAAWAPELRLRAYRGTNTGASVYGTLDASDRSTLTDGVATMLETRLVWRLDRVVFADEEVPIERLRLERAELRQRLAARVIELALAWLRARRASLDPALLGPDRELADATAIEALLALDALTGGAATKLLAPARANATAP